ncbi:MAG: hypothetical protein LBE09_07935 [Christensenellaceae bacterium]|jgi:hypothetical protein|nr:hypothetical protein [Christensenellaceae bacterium]
MEEPSNTLFLNEQPLILSPALAEKIGLKNAIVLQQVAYLCSYATKRIDNVQCVTASLDWWLDRLWFLKPRALKDIFKFLIGKDYIKKIDNGERAFFAISNSYAELLADVNTKRVLKVLPVCAATVGLNESFIIQHIHYSLETKSKYSDGKFFRASFDTWQSLLPFLSKTTLKQVVKNLVVKGVVKRKEVYVFADRTSWWTIDYGVLNMLIAHFKRTNEEIAKRVDAEKRILQSIRQQAALIKNDARECEVENHFKKEEFENNDCENSEIIHENETRPHGDIFLPHGYENRPQGETKTDLEATKSVLKQTKTDLYIRELTIDCNSIVTTKLEEEEKTENIIATVRDFVKTFPHDTCACVREDTTSDFENTKKSEDGKQVREANLKFHDLTPLAKRFDLFRRFGMPHVVSRKTWDDTNSPVEELFRFAGLEHVCVEEDWDQFNKLCDTDMSFGDILFIAETLGEEFDWSAVDFLTEMMNSREEDAHDINVAMFLHYLDSAAHTMFYAAGMRGRNRTLGDLVGFNNVDKLNLSHLMLSYIASILGKDFSWKKLELCARFYAGNEKLISEFFTDKEKSMEKALKTIKESEVA